MSPKLQCLLLRLSQYEMDVHYVTQKHVPIADCLSRLVVNATAVEDESTKPSDSRSWSGKCKN